jgi:chromosome segregation ATPase
MRALALSLLGLLLSSCSGAQIAYQQELERQKILLESVRTELADASKAVRAAHLELALLEERIALQEAASEGAVSREELARLAGEMEQRLALFDQRQSQALSDIRSLSGTAEERKQGLKAAREEIASLKRDFSQQMGTCKQALESVVALVQNEPRTYCVRQGDSLGKVAKANSTTVERLKELNGLKDDVIYPDQQLLLPPR